MKRKGLGKGKGMGYKNILPMDSHIHSLSARGVMSSADTNFSSSRTEFLVTFPKGYVEREQWLINTIERKLAKDRGVSITDLDEYPIVKRLRAKGEYATCSKCGKRLRLIKKGRLTPTICEVCSLDLNAKGDFAKTIVQQLGGGRFIAMTGAKNFVYDEKKRTLIFKIGRNAKNVNYVKITLRNDLYDVEFSYVTIKGIKVKSKVEGIYNDQLESVFKEHTGMNTRLFAKGWDIDSDYMKWKKGTKINYNGRKGVLLSKPVYKSTASRGWNEAKIKWDDGNVSNFDINRIGIKIWKDLPFPRLTKISNKELKDMLEQPYSHSIHLEDKEGKKRYNVLQKEARKRKIPTKVKVVEVSQFFDIDKETWKSMQVKKERGVLPSTGKKTYLWGETPKIKIVKRIQEPGWGQVWYIKDKQGKLKVFKANFDTSG